MSVEYKRLKRENGCSLSSHFFLLFFSRQKLVGGAWKKIHLFLIKKMVKFVLLSVFLSYILLLCIPPSAFLPSLHSLIYFKTLFLIATLLIFALCYFSLTSLRANDEKSCWCVASTHLAFNDDFLLKQGEKSEMKKAFIDMEERVEKIPASVCLLITLSHVSDENEKNLFS
jgi:hypothetical protein